MNKSLWFYSQYNSHAIDAHLTAHHPPPVMNIQFSEQDRIWNPLTRSQRILAHAARTNYDADAVGGIPAPNRAPEHFAIGEPRHVYDANIYGPVSSLMESDPRPMVRWSH